MHTGKFEIHNVTKTSVRLPNIVIVAALREAEPDCSGSGGHKKSRNVRSQWRTRKEIIKSETSEIRVLTRKYERACEIEKAIAR